MVKQVVKSGRREWFTATPRQNSPRTVAMCKLVADIKPQIHRSLCEWADQVAAGRLGNTGMVWWCGEAYVYTPAQSCRIELVQGKRNRALAHGVLNSALSGRFCFPSRSNSKKVGRASRQRPSRSEVLPHVDLGAKFGSHHFVFLGHHMISWAEYRPYSIFYT